MAKTIKRTKEEEVRDDFYTKYETVEKGVKTFLPFLKGKTVYCNCDDYRHSKFVAYFKDRFDEIGLNKLIATCFNEGGQGLKYVKTKKSVHTSLLNGDGSFASDECEKLLKADDVVVVTNPPFSLKESFVKLMMDTETPFLAILPQTTLTIKAISKYVLEEKLWFGDGIENGGVEFILPKSYPSNRTDDDGNKCAVLSGLKWLTNIDYPERYENDFKNMVRYKKNEYQRYDNLHGIDVPNVTQKFPHHYKGVMGVPVTFLYYYNPNKYRILGFRKGSDGKDLKIEGKCVFTRYLIQRREKA